MVGRKSGVCVNQIPSRSEPVGGFVEISFSSTQNLVKSNHPSPKYNQECWNTWHCFSYCPRHIQARLCQIFGFVIAPSDDTSKKSSCQLLEYAF